jgi:hypothetical protein
MTQIVAPYQMPIKKNRLEGKTSWFCLKEEYLGFEPRSLVSGVCIVLLVSPKGSFPFTTIRLTTNTTVVP